MDKRDLALRVVRQSFLFLSLSIFYSLFLHLLPPPKLYGMYFRDYSHSEVIQLSSPDIILTSCPLDWVIVYTSVVQVPHLPTLPTYLRKQHKFSTHTRGGGTQIRRGSILQYSLQSVVKC